MGLRMVATLAMTACVHVRYANERGEMMWRYVGIRISVSSMHWTRRSAVAASFKPWPVERG